MLRPRVIPCLLIQDKGLVKTVKFKDAKYVGDPINAVKIFNEKEADELVVLDIDATRNGVEPDFDSIRRLAAECRMPLCYGGGVTTAKQAKHIISLGVEKVAISAAAIDNPDLIKDIADEIGSQSVVVVLDIKRKMFGLGYDVYTHNGTINTKKNPFEIAKVFESLGAGEIVLNSIDNDGCMKGFDLDSADKLRRAVKIPITILGGAGELSHFKAAVDSCGIIGVSAGSFFVFKGPYKAVLISYPEGEIKKKLFLS
ncbi:imidazole glycerol phosphate synthase subunit HisF [Shewanella colwelliana]|uniref:imidazole glycerol-phosphate synthase n=1 Tax=Shewanella colwelliana TaxID=23 RepID=A0A1E5IVE1_SHECO|nr:AglZ/HisF2 family acetamidino modification protein [Shewanella colwelliana]OEG74531.1 imidazole glycerol phosphate synthase subunit HisF [Shewanella colwelliana]